MKIIQIVDGGAVGFDSVEEWVDYFGRSSVPIDKDLQVKMRGMIDAMPSGTVASFGGGWVLKDVKEVDFV